MIANDPRPSLAPSNRSRRSAIQERQALSDLITPRGFVIGIERGIEAVDELRCEYRPLIVRQGKSGIQKLSAKGVHTAIISSEYGRLASRTCFSRSDPARLFE